MIVFEINPKNDSMNGQIRRICMKIKEPDNDRGKWLVAFLSKFSIFHKNCFAIIKEFKNFVLRVEIENEKRKTFFDL